MRKRTVSCAAIVAAAALMAQLAAGPIAGAATRVAGRAAAHRAASSPRLVRPRSTPAGYKVVYSTGYTVSSGSWELGTVSCGTGEQPTFGSIYSFGAEGLSLSSSFPDESTGNWIVVVNNNSAATQSFAVFAICLKATSKTQVISEGSQVSAGTTEGTFVDCPKGTEVIGGGVQSGINVGTGIDSTFAYPALKQSSWIVEMSDASATDDTMTVYAVCRPKPANWSIQDGAYTNLAPGATAGVTVTCPTGTVAIAGGGNDNYDFGNFAGNVIDNSALATENEYVDGYYNGSGSSQSIQSVEVCAS